MHSCLERQLQSEQRAARELREEITLLERRIRLMGEDGDCAYERAMSTLYRKMVAERWQKIALLESRPV
jgi:CII-binding regulator of phage lambda lysogenization HflD